MIERMTATSPSVSGRDIYIWPPWMFGSFTCGTDDAEIVRRPDAKTSVAWHMRRSQHALEGEGRTHALKSGGCDMLSLLQMRVSACQGLKVIAQVIAPYCFDLGLTENWSRMPPLPSGGGAPFRLFSTADGITTAE